ncbi:hypothetical protein MRB53_024590 [Persea americana]|uniref:Uncharacterized protein n=1 Tax=Persea americana TaxID=3435 RepID=A0ACC2LD25_PERAE|nr:hypothetical protein MRB53_024590 [Persea americana]
MADQSSALMVVGGTEGEGVREYRKGNWTLNETLVLITAKKMDDERRMKKESGGEGRSTRPAELRWKWVEDYCWRNGCMRSQNQCNDKWDNLMRDYKKVRDHEKKAEEGTQEGSYWKLERHERKDKNLPTNLLPEIYEALVEVVERRGTQRVRLHGPDPNKGGFDPLEKTISSFPSSLPSLQHNSSHPAPSQPPPQPAQSLPSLDSDGSEFSNSPAKRRRKRGEGSSNTSSAHELSSAISKSASILSEALLQCEEKEDRRHKELINVEERKLKIEELKTDISSQAINGLTAAVNKLATSILALASDRNPSAPK